MKEINEILDFFQNLNEFIYVADIETHELVYMNKKTLDAYGFTSVEEIKGKPCYEILQKSSIPCGMCNNDKLCVGDFEEWRYYNPVVDKYMLLKDTLITDPETQKKYRIEIAIDITEEHAQDKAIQKYRDMETQINQGLRIALSADTPDETIQIILEHLGKSLNGERTYIFEKIKTAVTIILMNGLQRESHRKLIICRIFRQRFAHIGIAASMQGNISRFPIWRKRRKPTPCNMKT